jgi:hypothetical protein
MLLADHDVLADLTDHAGRHLVISGRSGRHRLLVKNPASRGGHVFVIVPDARRHARLAALASLHGGRDDRFTQRSPGANRPTAYQCHRLNLMLAILDHLGGGADRSITIRDLAETVLFPERRFGRSIEWKTSSWRRQTQRLVSEAIDMANGGYRKLLNEGFKGADCDAR